MAISVAPVVALIVVALVKLGHGYLGSADNAMMELRIADIGRHWPLVGPFSRDGWSHPGPMLFYLLAVPFRLTGSRSNGLLVGAALINASAIAGMILLARRRGGTPFAVLVASGSLILVSALGLDFVWDPWNPFITVIPFGVVVLAAWCVTCGDAWCLPVVAGVGSFCAQTHVGYVPLVGVLGIISVVAVVRTLAPRRGDRSVPGQRKALVLTAVLLAVLWAPPLVQQLTATPGNLQSIVHYFRSSGATHSLVDGYRVVAAQFAWNPEWLIGRTANPFSSEPRGLFVAPVPIWWLALAGALLLVWIKGPRSARRFGIVLIITIAASVVAIARTLGPLYEYRLRFVWVLGMLTAAFALWALWTWTSGWTRFPSRILAGVVLVTMVGLSAYNVVAAMDANPPNRGQGEIAVVLARQLERRLENRPGVVVVTANDFASSLLTSSIMVDLERHDVPVAVADNLDNRLRFGSDRMLSDQPIREALRVVVDSDIEGTDTNRCVREVAYWGRSTRRARSRALARAERIKHDVKTGRLTPQAALHDMAALSPDLSAAALVQLRSPRRSSLQSGTIRDLSC